MKILKVSLFITAVFLLAGCGAGKTIKDLPAVKEKFPGKAVVFVPKDYVDAVACYRDVILFKFSAGQNLMFVTKRFFDKYFEDVSYVSSLEEEKAIASANNLFKLDYFNVVIKVGDPIDDSVATYMKINWQTVSNGKPSGSGTLFSMTNCFHAFSPDKEDMLKTSLFYCYESFLKELLPQLQPDAAMDTLSR